MDRGASKLPGDACDRDWIWDHAVETASAEDVRERAAAAWERQGRHLLENSRFHSRRLATVPLAELDRLPFTTKDDLRAAIAEAPPFGTNLCVPEARVKRVYQTSGTTGSPSVVALTTADAAAWAEIGARTYYATGVHDHHSVVSTFGAGPFVAGHTYFVLDRIGARSVPVGPGDTERVLFALRAGIADTLLVTPSFAQHLADRVRGEPLGLRHVVCGGEPGGGIPEVRGHLEAALCATVNEIMGIGDVSPSLFGECPNQQGMHFCGTGLVWPELVDPDSREPVAIEAGAVGEMVYTHLAREAMPVVRFLSGDLVRVEGTACGCGRTGFRVRCIGRRDDMFIVRGVNVHPSAILAVVAGFRPRVTGRLRVMRPEGKVAVEPPVPVEVECEPAGDPALAAELEAAIRARLNFRAAVRLVPQAEFGDAGYKTRLVVRG
jgi:phenylacetate-CoA ligase